jgi:hypothetical protein
MNLGLVRHTDGQREWAYDRHSRIGKLERCAGQAAPYDASPRR